jgi:hypothetical protein
MTKITSKRGTSTIKAEDVKNWAGETFKQFQKEQLNVAGMETVLSQKRGTSTILAKDIPDVPENSLKGQKITTQRGTSTVTL